jgi:gamma-F420-2:alpha-L-glutamate ligase
MRVFILYPYTTPRSNNAFDWFCEAFSKFDIEAEVYFWGVPRVPKSSLVSLSGEEMQLSNRNRPDLAIIRGYNSGLSMWFEMKNIPVINRCKSMEWCRDKIYTVRLLQRSGIAVPRTIEADECPEANKYECVSEAFYGKPFVMKLAFGSKGEDVYLVENREQFESAMECVRASAIRRLAEYDAGGGRWTEEGAWRDEVLKGCRVLFQEYIATSRGRDFRVWVVGGKVAGYVLRSNSTSFRSNFAQGGKPLYPPLPKEAAQLAIAATGCLGLDFAGVDLLLLDESPNPADCHRFTVCEINGNAGFRTANTSIPEAVALIAHNILNNK